MKTKKEKILELLKKEDLSTGNISVLIKSNYYSTIVFCNELKEEKRIELVRDKNRFKWRLKDGRSRTDISE